MKYFFRKLRMIKVLYANIKGDKCRTKDFCLAILYMLRHPSLFFVRKHIETDHDCVLKDVNVIVNTPYINELYEIYH